MHVSGTAHEMLEISGGNGYQNYRLRPPAASNKAFHLESRADGESKSLTRLLQAEIRRQRGDRLLKREIPSGPRREHAPVDRAGRTHQRIQRQRIIRVVNAERLLPDGQQDLP